MRRLWMTALFVTVALAGAAQASPSVKVHGVQLLDASGVPSEPMHTYGYKVSVDVGGGDSGGFWPFSSNTHVNPISIGGIGQGRWNQATGEATENLSVAGDVQGKISSHFTCSSDPWLGSASCSFVSAQAQIPTEGTPDWAPIVKSYGKPFGTGQFSVADAVVLSAKNKKAGGAPAPAPKKPPLTREWVNAPKPTTAKAVPGATPKTRLTVVSVQPTVDPACGSLSAVVTAKIGIASSGLFALPAGAGHLQVAEVWGANLKSHEIALPAFGASETKTIEVPVEVPKVSVPALPGSHNLNVSLKPLGAKFATPDSAFTFTVVFPAGQCHAKLQEREAPAHAAGSRGGTGTQVPAVQQRPLTTPRSR
jgi:hypothetical protein